MAPYGSASVHGAGGGGYVTRLPAPVVRELQLESVDRYLCPISAGAIVLVPEGAEVPVVPKEDVEPASSV